MNFIPVSDVIMDDPLWSKRFTLVRDVVLPHMWEILNDRVPGAEISHCVENFKIAAGLSNKTYYGVVFIDSDLYKWIEAASYVLSVEENKFLSDHCKLAIDLIKAAQQDDGYINTYFTLKEPGKRWTNLMEGHELYCAGYLIEAAVAYFQATGDNSLLQIACKFTDLIDETFGPNKKRGYPGHPEIEIALIRLYEVTHEERYLNLAGYFINERGAGQYLFAEEIKENQYHYIFPDMAHFDADYFQAHAPIRQQTAAAGHAVRAMYLYTAMADYTRLTGDASMVEACDKLYQNTISKQLYVTGGVGAAKLGERFTTDYDLPSASAYSETCAAIGLMFFSSRMWKLNRNKSCYDIWEQALFNTVLSGMGKDGKHFFYVNPIEVVPQTVKNNSMLTHVKTQRQKWFGVACCPPNIARILTSLHGYIYALENDRLYILSHIGSSFQHEGIKGQLVRQGNHYSLSIEAPKAMDIYLRLPENSTLTGETYEINEDGYFIIHHPAGEQQYTYTLEPQIRVLHAHPHVSALAGQVCVQRGLTTYCVEGVDNPVPLSKLRIPAGAVFNEESSDWLENDMPVLKTNAYALSLANWQNKLYDDHPNEFQESELTFIPYSQWANRGENEMRVWLNEK